MILESISHSSAADELGLLTKEGLPSERAAADIFRTLLARWGLAPRSAYVRYVRAEFQAAGIDSRGALDVGGVLDRLVGLGDCN